MTPTQIAAIKGMLAYFDSGNNIPVDKAVIKGNCAEVAALRAALAETAPVQEPVAWLPMDTAPKDGTHVFLQVEFEDHAMEDGPAPQQTIGSNTSENDGGPDEWQFAGWDWVHDRYTQGVGTPVSWLPKTALLALVQQPAMQEPECYKWEEYCKWAKGWGWDTCESEYDPRLPEYAKYHEGTDFDGPNVRNFRALYTAPQAQQPAPPADVPMLTDDEILNAYCANPSERQYVTVFCAGAKWAEKTLRQKAGLT